MANVDSSKLLHVREVSRRLVKAASSVAVPPQVIAANNLDLLDTDYPVSFVCVYPRPPSGDFAAVVATFEASLPSFLSHWFPLAGRVVTNPGTGLPEIHCNNEGAELVVGVAGVPLSSLDFSRSGDTLCRIPMPFDPAIALSVQLVSFSCGGFAVSWGWSHVVGDGCATCTLVDMWSAFARTGGTGGVVPLFYDRSSVFPPRSPPSYGPSFGDAYMLETPEQHVNVLTNRSFAERLYYVEARDVERLRGAASSGRRRATRMEAVSAYLWKALAGVVGSGDARCRMGWWVNGRPHAPAAPSEQLRGYLGNVTSFAVREAATEEVQRAPPSKMAAMVREAVAATANAEHFQELADWLEEHKAAGRKYIEAATVGLGSPALCVTWLATFRTDTDFGFGRAALAMPAVVGGRECSGFVGVADKPGRDGDLLVGAFMWPCLAAALEADGILKPVTPDYLGFTTTSSSPDLLMSSTSPELQILNLPLTV